MLMPTRYARDRFGAREGTRNKRNNVRAVFMRGRLQPPRTGEGGGRHVVKQLDTRVAAGGEGHIEKARLTKNEKPPRGREGKGREEGTECFGAATTPCPQPIRRRGRGAAVAPSVLLLLSFCRVAAWEVFR